MGAKKLLGTFAQEINRIPDVNPPFGNSVWVVFGAWSGTGGRVGIGECGLGEGRGVVPNG